MTAVVSIKGCLPPLCVAMTNLGFKGHHSNAFVATNVEYPSPNRKKTGTTEQGFIDQSEARATRQTPSTRVLHAGRAAHYILLFSRVLLWLAAYLPRVPLERREIQDWLRPGGPTCLRPNPTPHHNTSPH
uniref:Secreted protein n=1 Tax=Mesocestoides corti TaxID=53468 RepID=A0A5K3G2Y8_MESCO